MLIELRSSSCWLLPESRSKTIEQYIAGFHIRVVGNPPRQQNLHARKPRESSAKGVRQGRAAKAAAKADRYIVEAHFNIDVHHYLQAVFRESNRERYYETPVAAKAKTVHAKAVAKASKD